jgi:hypothetical protein
MKKAFAILAVIATVALVGCSKSKDCNCKVTQTVPGGEPMVTNVTYTADDGDCDQFNSTTTVSGMQQTIKCD